VIFYGKVKLRYIGLLFNAASVAPERGTIPSSNRYAMLEKIEQKTLIIHGNKDIVVQPVNALILAERLPDAQLVVYSDSRVTKWAIFDAKR
jgi:pimeloyl-ACP methyl ester carboxylesterase